MQAPSSSLPTCFDPWRLAAESGRLDGALAVVVLPRFAAALEHTAGEVSIALTGGVNPQGVCFIAGCLQTEIKLVCQRCLSPLQWSLNAAVSLGLVHDEAEADCLPEEYDPLLVPESFINITDLVENELLLALPQIPRHDEMWECEANGYQMPPRESFVEQRQPFATLASLLRNTEKSY